MARSTKTAAAKTALPARKSTVLARAPAKGAAAAPIEAPVAKTVRRAVKSEPSTPAPAPAPARKIAAAPVPAKAAPPPKLSKDELKVLAEKLERNVATLRTKGRDMTRAAKAASSRIAELEAEVTRLEGVVARAEAAAKRAAQPAKRTTTVRAAKMSSEPEVDAGDAGEPEVAAETPPPVDEDEAAST